MNRFFFALYYWVFRVLASVLPPTPDNLRQRPFRRILVFSAAGIGDTLTDSVAIRALKESFPEAKITLVTHRRRIDLARHNPYADEVLRYYKSFFRFFSLSRELRRRNPDVVVMLRGNDPDLWPLAYLANRHAVVSCLKMTRFGFLVSHPVSIPAWDETHGVEQTLDIVRYIGADTKDRRLVYQVREHEVAMVKQKLIDFGAETKPIIIFQLGGGPRSSWRDWPAENFAALGNRLLRTYKVQLVLMGGGDQLQKSSEVNEALPEHVLNLVGKFPLNEVGALLSLAKVLVSTDTGIMHLGFAVSPHVLSLIHCNNPGSRVGPYGYGDQHRTVQLQPPPGVAVSKEVSMKLLTPEMVWAELEKLCNIEAISRR